VGKLVKSSGSNPEVLTVRIRPGLPTTRRMIMDVIVEIRAAEGGNDAKLLVVEQLQVYARYMDRSCL
jgi:protein subunit release factor A